MPPTNLKTSPAYLPIIGAQGEHGWLLFTQLARQVSFGLKLRNPQQFKFLWMSSRALAVLFQPTSRSWACCSWFRAKQAHDTENWTMNTSKRIIMYWESKLSIFLEIFRITSNRGTDNFTCTKRKPPRTQNKGTWRNFKKKTCNFYFDKTLQV